MAIGNIDRHHSPHWHEYSGVVALIVLAVAVFAVGLFLKDGSGLIFGGASEIVSGAVILGVSIMFASIVAGGFALLVSRINAFGAIMSDIKATESGIERGLMLAAKIKARGAEIQRSGKTLS